MNHHCHWPGCPKQVPPKLWGCLPHWKKLPPALRARVWKAYVPGQEIRKDPSPEYLKVASDVQTWCLEQNAKVGKQGELF